MNTTTNNNSSSLTTKAIHSLGNQGWGVDLLEAFIECEYSELGYGEKEDMAKSQSWELRWTLSNLLMVDDMAKVSHNCTCPADECDFATDLTERYVLFPKGNIGLDINEHPYIQIDKDRLIGKILQLVNRFEEDEIVIMTCPMDCPDPKWTTTKLTLTEKIMNTQITPGDWKERSVAKAKEYGKNGFKIFVKTQEQRREFLAWYYNEYPTKEGRLFVNVIVKEGN